MRKATHTGTLRLGGALIASHVLEDGTRVIPSPSVARLLDGSDRRSVQDIVATPLVATQARGRFLAAEQEYFPIGSKATERGFTTDAVTDLVIEMAYADPDIFTEGWHLQLRNRARELLHAFIMADPGLTPNRGVRH